MVLLATVWVAFAESVQTAPPPGTTQLPPIDLSPGFDVTSPGSLVLNRSTHRLYVSRITGFMDGVKVIDTRSNAAVGGVSFGAYASGDAFRGFAMAVDDGAAPDGNKLYVVGGVGKLFVLRVIDGLSDTNVTSEGTDIILPITPGYNGYPFARVAVNPTTHKVYVVTDIGQVAVVDAKTRTVKTLNPNAGSFLAVDPVANKIFVLGKNGGAIIDGATDTVTAPPQPLLFIPSAAAFNDVDRRIYLAGRQEDGAQSGAYVLDGESGLLVASRTDFGSYNARGIALVPNENTAYLGIRGKIFALDTRDLSVRGDFTQRNLDVYGSMWSGDVACDPAVSSALYAVYGQVSPQATPNAVVAIDRTSGAVTQVTTAYFPARIAVNARTNRIYVLDSQVPELVVIDGEERSVIARVQLPSGGGDIAVSERLDRVYLTDTVYVDGATNQLHGPVQLIGSTRFLAIDDTRRRLYGSRLASRLRFQGDWVLDTYDVDAAALLNSLSLGRTGTGGGHVAANPVTGRVYVSVAAEHWSSSSFFYVIDGAASQLVMSTPEIVGAEGGIGINRKTNDIYVPQPNGNITVVNGTTNQVAASFPAGGTGPDNPRFTGIAVDEEADTITLTELPSTEEKNVGRMLTYDGHNGHALLGEMEIGNPGAGLAFNPATRQFVAPNLNDGTITVIQMAATAARNQFGNLSTRLRVGGSADVMISGVIVNAPAGATKKVIVRAVGPSLESLGVKGALADTTLELHTAAGEVITNDNWKINEATDASQQAEIEATGLAPSDDREAAIVAELPAGAHTAIIRGKDGATGVGLAEVFILENDSLAQLANIATRGRVGTGEDVMIGGVIVKGTTASRVLVRAIGPSLQGQLAGALQDPMLELRDINGGLIAINDDWRSNHESEIAATTIPPDHDKESAILADLFPGNYTAIVWGAGDTTGVAIVEAYHVQ